MKTNSVWDAQQIAEVLHVQLQSWQGRTGATVKINKRVIRRVDSYMFGGGISFEFGIKGTQKKGKRMIVSVTEDEEDS